MRERRKKKGQRRNDVRIPDLAWVPPAAMRLVSTPAASSPCRLTQSRHRTWSAAAACGLHTWPHTSPLLVFVLRGDVAVVRGRRFLGNSTWKIEDQCPHWLRFGAWRDGIADRWNYGLRQSERKPEGKAGDGLRPPPGASGQEQLWSLLLNELFPRKIPSLGTEVQ